MEQKILLEEKNDILQGCQGIQLHENETIANNIKEIDYSTFLMPSQIGLSQNNIINHSSSLSTSCSVETKNVLNLLTNDSNNSSRCEFTQNNETENNYAQFPSSRMTNLDIGECVIDNEVDMKITIANDAPETFVAFDNKNLQLEDIKPYLNSIKEEKMAEDDTIDSEDFSVDTAQCYEENQIDLLGKVFKTISRPTLNVPNFSCMHCSFTTTSKANLGGHMVGHVNMTLSAKRNNQISDNSNGLKKCTQCNYFTTTRQGLIIHISALHRTQKEFVCTLCSETFTSARGVKIHTKVIHTKSNLFYCFNCKFSSKHKKGIEQHMELHTGVFSYKCHLCDFKTASSEYLPKHVKLHNALFTQYLCPHCDYKTCHRLSLRNHVRVHTGEKPFCCSICGKFYVCADTLKRHLETHSTEKSHACNICDFRGRTAFVLSNHIKNKHLPTTIFPCNECDFSSKSKKSLEIHLRKHSGERAYACNICSFRTYHPFSLYLHRNRHTRKKVYDCSDCNYITTHAANFGLHRRRHTGVGSMTCFRCNHTTTHRSNFIHHVSKTCTRIKTKLKK